MTHTQRLEYFIDLGKKILSNSLKSKVADLKATRGFINDSVISLFQSTSFAFFSKYKKTSSENSNLYSDSFFPKSPAHIYHEVTNYGNCWL